MYRCIYVCMIRNNYKIIGFRTHPDTWVLILSMFPPTLHHNYNTNATKKDLISQLYCGNDCTSRVPTSWQHDDLDELPSYVRVEFLKTIARYSVTAVVKNSTSGADRRSWEDSDTWACEVNKTAAHTIRRSWDVIWRIV